MAVYGLVKERHRLYALGDHILPPSIALERNYFSACLERMFCAYGWLTIVQTEDNVVGDDRTTGTNPAVTDMPGKLQAFLSLSRGSDKGLVGQARGGLGRV